MATASDDGAVTTVAIIKKVRIAEVIEMDASVSLLAAIISVVKIKSMVVDSIVIVFGI